MTRSRKEKRADAAQSVINVALKGGVGAVPIAGPLLAEVIGEVLGSKRVSRIEDLLEKTVMRVDALANNAGVEELLQNEENQELLQEAILSAAKKASDLRRSQIANLLSGGLIDVRKESRCSLMKLQDSLSDTDILILMSFCLSGRDYEDFVAVHGPQVRKEVVDVNGVVHDVGLSAPDYQLSIKRLESSGLIERKMNLPRQINSADALKRFIGHITEIRKELFVATSLGRVLCALIDPENKIKYADPHSAHVGFIPGLDDWSAFHS